MKLDGEDREYLDGKFDSVHKRITEHDKTLSGLTAEFKSHEKNECPNVREHVKNEHKGAWTKIIVAIAAFLTAAAVAIGLLQKLL